MMKTPADKTAKRLSAEDWFARYGVSLPRTAPSQTQRPPADRIAVRA
jgi:hypothetical protein